MALRRGALPAPVLEPALVCFANPQPTPLTAPPSLICSINCPFFFFLFDLEHVADALLGGCFGYQHPLGCRIPKPITAFASHYTGDMATLAQTISNDIHVKNPDVKYACAEPCVVFCSLSLAAAALTGTCGARACAPGAQREVVAMH